jgi:peptidoglycan/LPS O-acetylase OafA/YrhL
MNKILQRFHVLDYLRALCILYIVGFWHLLNYSRSDINYEFEATYQATVIVLGLFVMISGFLVGQKQIIFQKSDLGDGQPPY